MAATTTRRRKGKLGDEEHPESSQEAAVMTADAGKKEIVTVEEEEVESHLRPSLLSSEAFTNAENGYKGFVNLALLLLGLVNFRLVVENLIKYGLLFIESSSEFTIEWRSWPGLTISLINSSFARSEEHTS